MSLGFCFEKKDLPCCASLARPAEPRQTQTTAAGPRADGGCRCCCQKLEKPYMGISTVFTT